MSATRPSHVVPFLAAAALLVLPVATARAATHFVPTDFPTIQAAVDAAVAGDEIVIENGGYIEDVDVIGRSDLVIRGESVDGVIVSHPARGPTFDIGTSFDIELTSMTITTELPGGDNPNDGGVRVQQSAGIELHHLKIRNGAANGVVVRSSDIDIWNNFIDHMGDDGISFRSGMAGTSRASIYNNTFADLRGGTGIGVWLDNAFTSVEVFNNIFYNCDWGIYKWQSSIPLNHDFNVFWANVSHVAGTSLQPGEPVCDPLFVSPPTGDYHLDPASCAVDAGVGTYFGVDAPADDIDYDGRPDGASEDAGADEIGGGCADSTPPDIIPGVIDECFASEADAIDAALAATTATDDGGSVTLDATISGAPCDAVVTVTATDECDNVASTDYAVTIDPNDPVLVGVPPDAVVPCDAVPPPASVTATDDCTGSPTVGFVEMRIDGPCAGTYQLLRTWTATDDCGRTATATQTIDVVDEEGPTVVASAEPLGCLWPPNHGVVCLDVADLPALEATDACGSEPITWMLAGCASSQPEDDIGDGSTEPDCIVEDGGARTCFRVERQGPRLEGRDYSILVVAVDACGNASDPTPAGVVHVPHDRRPPRGDCVGATGHDRAGRP